MSTLNGAKYSTKNPTGRNSISDYQGDRAYWIAQGGNPKLALNDMKYAVLRGLYPSAGKALHDLERTHFRTISGT